MRVMTLPLAVAAVDALAAVYFLGWALLLKRTGRARVLVVGLMLTVCAAFLAVVGWLHVDEQVPSLPPLPAAPGSSV